MPYRTIIILLFSFFFQTVHFAIAQTNDLLKKAQKEIDSIVNTAIEHRAFPGAVIYASIGDSILLYKAYGHHTYDSVTSVGVTDLYDLASLTKVMGSGLALMKLYEDGLIELDEPLYKYVRGIRFSRIRNLTIRECLAHQSGLPGWIKYYERIKKWNENYKRKTIVNSPRKNYTYPVADGMWLHEDFYQEIKKYIKRSKLAEQPEYKYSGLFFYLVPEIVENCTGQPYEDFLSEHFFDPIGAPTITFNPYGKFGLNEIVPTEIDTFFRYEQIHGRVHDEGAILMEGVSGNAGLFGNANDISKIWRMLLKNGMFEGRSYLKPVTIDLFTTTQYPQSSNRRGLAFDKPLLEYDSIMSSVAQSAPLSSYGHTGYTGTLAWADPDTDLLFIFLSNRVYPTRLQKAIYELNVRPSIHQILYDYIHDN